MSKMMVVAFHDEKKAYEGSRALGQLHDEGSITVYAAAVVARDADGKISIKDDADEGPIGTVLGMMTGSLIGVFGGPAGVVVGAMTGGMLGSIGDLINLGVGTDFVDEVGRKLEPGMVAVVAEVGENWVTPVDTRMEELGGIVIRRSRADVEDDQIERDMAAFDADLKQLKAEINEANDKNKAKLQKKVDKTKKKLAESRDRAEKKIAALNQERDAKLTLISKQIAEAKDEAKVHLEKRKDELQNEYATRTNKLKKAWDLTKDAIT